MCLLGIKREEVEWAYRNFPLGFGSFVFAMVKR